MDTLNMCCAKFMEVVREGKARIYRCKECGHIDAPRGELCYFRATTDRASEIMALTAEPVGVIMGWAAWRSFSHYGRTKRGKMTYISTFWSRAVPYPEIMTPITRDEAKAEDPDFVKYAEAARTRY